MKNNISRFLTTILLYILQLLILVSNTFLFSQLLGKEPPLPMELQQKYNKWNAEVIAVQGPHTMGYITGKTLSPPCNYYKNAVITQTGSDFKITTQHNTEFGWTDQRIGAEWAYYWYPYEIHFIADQSLPFSKWSVNGIDFELKGTNKQLIKVAMGSLRYRLDKLIFRTNTPNNTVIFSSPVIVRPHGTKFFRQTFILSHAPASAELVISTAPYYSLYINGTLVLEKGGGSDFDRIYTHVDCTQYLKAGLNTIAVSCESYHWKYFNSTPPEINNAFFLEGVAYHQDGSITHFFTDSSWKASFKESPEWFDAQFDDSQWQSAKSLGNVGESSLSGFGQDGGGWFTNPPYFGQIFISPPNNAFPFFKENEMCTFHISAHIPKEMEHAITLDYTVKDFLTYKTVLKNTLLHSNWISGKLEFNFIPFTLPQGSYLMELSLRKNSKLIDTRYYEFLVLGSIQQEEVSTISPESLNLILVDHIDCTKILFSHPFTSSPHLKLKEDRFGSFTRLRSSPAGKYRESNQNLCAWFSYQFTIKNLYKPHLISLYYPDDKERTIGIAIHEKPSFSKLTNLHSDSGILRSSTGVYTGGILPLSNTMKRLSFVYWPNNKTATITVLSNQHKSAAGIQKIDIYEFEDDLPALLIPNNLNQCRIGTMSERAFETLPRTFYGGSLGGKFIQNFVHSNFVGYYKAWYITLSNFIQYLRFTGQNMYSPSIYMYYGANYPSQFAGRAEYGIDLSISPPKDYFALMAKMFEYNRLTLIPGIEFIGSPQTRNETDTASDEAILSGTAQSSRLVSRNGKQCYTSWMEGGLNPLIPENKNAFLRIFTDFASRYKDFSAIKGFAVYAGTPLFPSFGPLKYRDYQNERNPLYWGYDDWTVAEFENETGIKIPTNDAKNRFHGRFKYLTEKYNESWVQWRNDKIKAVFLSALEIIQSYRTDWHLSVFPTIPSSDYMIEIMQKNTSVHTLLRNAGLDPSEYKSTDHLSFAPMIRQTANRWIKVKDNTPNYTEDVSSIYLSDSFRDLFDFQSDTSAFIHTGFMTECIMYTKKNWLWNLALMLGYPAPSEQHFLKSFTETMAGVSPTTINLFWTDITHKVGHEEELSSFAQTYLTLPKIAYFTLFRTDTLSIKGNVWNGDFYFFIVQTSSTPRQITLQFTDFYPIKDLPANQYIVLQPHKAYYDIRLDMKGYSFKTFKIENLTVIPKIAVIEE